jgi:hypothetical protein
MKKVLLTLATIRVHPCTGSPNSICGDLYPSPFNLPITVVGPDTAVVEEALRRQANDVFRNGSAGIWTVVVGRVLTIGTLGDPYQRLEISGLSTSSTRPRSL